MLDNWTVHPTDADSPTRRRSSVVASGSCTRGPRSKTGAVRRGRLAVPPDLYGYQTRSRRGRHGHPRNARARRRILKE